MVFRSAPPARGATTEFALDVGLRLVSIRAPRTGGDRMVSAASRAWARFNPSPPHGGRQVTRRPRGTESACFNPRPPHGGRPDRAARVLHLRRVSIRAPRTGGDMIGSTQSPLPTRFQSAPPARGATSRRSRRVRPSSQFQSAPSARGRHFDPEHRAGVFGVSIRAPRTGGDVYIALHRPTPYLVSIRAPRTGGDTHGFSGADGEGRFNPRPPHGGRPWAAAYAASAAAFQSAPPARGATVMQRHRSTA